MRVFEIATPDGRKVRHKAESVEAAKASLLRGYSVSGEVLGADPDMTGGFVVMIGGKSMLAVLLECHGDDMSKWLESQGYVKKTL